VREEHITHSVQKKGDESDDDEDNEIADDLGGEAGKDKPAPKQSKPRGQKAPAKREDQITYYVHHNSYSRRMVYVGPETSFMLGGEEWIPFKFVGTLPLPCFHSPFLHRPAFAMLSRSSSTSLSLAPLSTLSLFSFSHYCPHPYYDSLCLKVKVLRTIKYARCLASSCTSHTSTCPQRVSPWLSNHRSKSTFQ
jgi:hypothetical protein